MSELVSVLVKKVFVFIENAEIIHSLNHTIIGQPIPLARLFSNPEKYIGVREVASGTEPVSTEFVNYVLPRIPVENM
ncbi:MAG: hypothetical protein CAPSK01_000886 [Candidatus Accumulibacter vicinus]|uniref:Uncharacterized protein n=1 Tax=Candidatus Accumulibacter vicinus TaxID=2954382 RepID=A0A084Y3W8_9PROT|nr:MAG: hypothetical protein CAPSK01_000886 [Candidatus Accumulibacter vicinus]